MIVSYYVSAGNQPNSGLLEQSVLLTEESSLQPPSNVLFKPPNLWNVFVSQPLKTNRLTMSAKT